MEIRVGYGRINGSSLGRATPLPRPKPFHQFVDDFERDPVGA